jgi:hypothetical protein
MANEKIEKVPFNELPESAKKIIDANIGYYSLALIGLKNSGTRTENVALTASGTLIQTGGTHYILTAGHVVAALFEHSCDALGFNISHHTHAFKVQMAALRTSYRWNKSAQGIGPDIGLILLPSELLGEFTARKNFWNIDLNKNEAINRKYSDEFLWAACGAPFQMTNIEENGRGHKRTLSQHMGPWLADKIRRFETGDFDYIDMVFEGTPDPGWPNDFRGLSGGGLWYIILKRNADKSIGLQHLLLSGLAFYQMQQDPQLSLIRCHAEKSIYIKIHDLIREMV